MAERPEKQPFWRCRESRGPREVAGTLCRKKGRDYAGQLRRPNSVSGSPVIPDEIGRKAWKTAHFLRSMVTDTLICGVIAITSDKQYLSMVRMPTINHTM
ncbi:hypothetical protein Kim5_PA00006 (plasmid) [Rhizobium sp. Kim5]|nr:hypothetical protein Kim5_PA00006 [Rhizobium sp. Kim5]